MPTKVAKTANPVIVGSWHEAHSLPDNATRALQGIGKKT